MQVSVLLLLIVAPLWLRDVGVGVDATFGNEYVHIKLHVPKTAASSAHKNLHALEEAAAATARSKQPQVIHKVIHHHHHHSAPPSAAHSGRPPRSRHHSAPPQQQHPGKKSGGHSQQHNAHNHHVLEAVLVSELKDASNIDSSHLDYLNHAGEIAKHVAPHLQAKARPKLHSYVETYAFVEERPPPAAHYAPQQQQHAHHHHHQHSTQSQQSHHPHIETLHVMESTQSYHAPPHHQTSAQYAAPQELPADSYLPPQFTASAYRAPRPQYGVPDVSVTASAAHGSTQQLAGGGGGGGGGGYHQPHHHASPRPTFASAYHSPQTTRGYSPLPINYPTEEDEQDDEGAAVEGDYRGYDRYQPSVGESASASASALSGSDGYQQLSGGYLPPETLVAPQTPHSNAYPTYEDAALAGVGEPEAGGVGAPLPSWPESPHKYRAAETYTGIDSYRAAHVQGVGSGGYAYNGPYP